MRTDTTYNGWTNRATWLVALWLNNDQGSQTEAMDVATGAYVDAIGNLPLPSWEEDGEAANRYGLGMAGDAMEAWVTEWIAPTSGLASDLMGTSLASVDWPSVADAFVREDELIS